MRLSADHDDPGSHPPCPSCGCDHGHVEDCALMPSDFRELVFGDPAKSGGVVESLDGKQYVVGEAAPETIPPLFERWWQDAFRGIVTADELRAILGPSPISRLMKSRRARAQRRKPVAPETESIHSAIAAMQRPGRAHEL